MQLLRVGAGAAREKFVLSAETQEEATALRFALDKAKAEEREAIAKLVHAALGDDYGLAAAIRDRGN